MQRLSDGIQVKKKKKKREKKVGGMKKKKWHVNSARSDLWEMDASVLKAGGK